MKSYIIKILSMIVLVIGLLVLIIKGLLLTIKANGGLLYPKEGLLYATWGIFGVAIILGIIILCYIFRNKKTLNKGTESTKKKEVKEPSFVDFIVLVIFVFTIATIVFVFQNRKALVNKITGVEEVKTNIIVSVVSKEKSQSWELSWQRSEDVSWDSYDKKKNVCSKVIFLKKDQKVMNFTFKTDGSNNEVTHCTLTTENKQKGRKWKGTCYDEKTKNTGFMGFDEVRIDNEIMYIGEHSTDKKSAEWIPTIIRLKNE
jgi:hypothetical protein